MGACPLLRRFTSDKYHRLKRASDTRHEFFDGHIYAMAGSTMSHDRVVVNTMVLSQNQLKGGKCGVRSPDFRIAVSNVGPHCYPDLSVMTAAWTAC